MDFGLSDDQKLLDETVRGFLADRVPITRVRALRDADEPADPAIWKSLAELGVTGVLVPETHGGSGLGLLDAALVSQALGHAVTPAPFLSSGVMAPVALASVGGGERWLGGIATGDIVFGAAFTETFSIRENAGIALSRDALAGKAMMAIDAIGADFVLVAIGDDRLAVVRGAAADADLDRTRAAVARHRAQPGGGTHGERL